MAQIAAGDRPVPAKRTTPLGHVIIALDRGIYRVARHWLFAVNGVFALHVASLVLAPLLAAWGHAGIARPLYAYNRVFCHQRDDHSFHLAGHKLACCQRCAAIYGACLLCGLLFALLRGRVRPPRVPELAILALPVVIDGGGQMLGFWTSTPASRVGTGALLGGAVCWWLLPWLSTGFAGIRTQIETLFARLVAENRARPL